MIEFPQIWNARPKIVFSTTLASAGADSRLVRGDVGEYRLLVHPVVLGGGLPFFPTLDAPVRLRLRETRWFASGVTLLSYATA